MAKEMKDIIITIPEFSKFVFIFKELIFFIFLLIIRLHFKVRCVRKCTNSTRNSKDLSFLTTSNQNFLKNGFYKLIFFSYILLTPFLWNNTIFWQECKLFYCYLVNWEGGGASCPPSSWVHTGDTLLNNVAFALWNLLTLLLGNTIKTWQGIFQHSFLNDSM